MAITGLGDIDVETTIQATGEASDTQTFTQTSNNTYSVDVSSTASVSPYPIGGSRNWTSFGQDNDGIREHIVAVGGTSITATLSGSISATFDGSSVDPAADFIVDGSNMGSSVSNVTVNDSAYIYENANNQELSFDYDWDISQSVSSDANVDSITQS